MFISPKNAARTLFFVFTFSAIVHSVFVLVARGQAAKNVPDDGETEAQRLALLNDIRSLAADSSKLLAPLAQAAAEAEVADAAWSLDRELAERLLRDAYRRTLPKEGEGTKGAQAGAAQSLWASPEGRARLAVRARVMAVASRDEKLAEEIVQEGAEVVPKSEGGDLYDSVARIALDEGDAERVSRFMEKSFELDPTNGASATIINDLAKRDRTAADRLIIKYIENLRKFPLSSKGTGAAMVDITFIQLLNPNSFFGDTNGEVPPPGPAVMRAYVGYVIESLTLMERNEPGSSKSMRAMLMSAWLPLKRYAPEMQAAFMELEVASRTPGRSTALPTPDSEKVWRERRDKQLKAGEESATPDDRTINSLINEGEFDRARKAIDKLPDGPGKAQHTEKLNMKEALRLAYKGDAAGAALAAERLTKASVIVEVYAALIKNCAGRKDAACVSNLALRAVRQLEKADTTNFTPPAGTPSSFFAGAQESDASLKGLSRLAVSVAPFDATLAFEIFERMVAAANRSTVDTKLGRAGYDVSVFKALAALDETRTRQAVISFDDGLRRVTALAAILKWKAEALDKPRAESAAQ